MKITDIRSESYQWPKPVVVTSGRGKGGHQYLYNRLTLVYIETDEGITGIGSGMRVEYLEAFKKMLIGEDLLCIEKIYQKMIDNNNHQLKNCITTISAIDIALWDLKAKVANMPLYKLWAVSTTSWSAMWQAVIMQKARPSWICSTRWKTI